MKKLPPTRWRPKTKREQQLYREWKAFCLRGARRTRRLYAWRQRRLEAWEIWEDGHYDRFTHRLKDLQSSVNWMVSSLNYPKLFDSPVHDMQVVRRLEIIELQARLMRYLLLKEIAGHHPDKQKV